MNVIVSNRFGSLSQCKQHGDGGKYTCGNCGRGTVAAVVGEWCGCGARVVKLETSHAERYASIFGHHS